MKYCNIISFNVKLNFMIRNRYYETVFLSCYLTITKQLQGYRVFLP